MRLVNVDDCNRELFYKQMGGKDSLITVETAFDMLEVLPTAYDVDKVVEQLEKLPKGSAWNHNSDNIDRKKTIEIVKGGGLDEV